MTDNEETPIPLTVTFPTTGATIPDGGHEAVWAPDPPTIDEQLADMPLGSRVEFTRGEPDKWVVYRGPGVSQHGEATTLSRAIRLVGAKYEHALDENGKQTNRMILIDESGTPILPE